MANLLFLVHRLPYPPNKGDKVRSFHLLKHLARQHRVFLGTFIDDPEDAVHLDTVRAWCADMYVARLSPRTAKLKSLVGLFTGEALSLPYYRHRGLRDWVANVCASQSIDRVVVFSSVMADFVPDMNRLTTLVDFVDLDSAKWTQYAEGHRWPLSWIYRREGVRLLSWERKVAARARRCFFVTEAEVELFRRAAPECAAKVEAIGNGVDAEFFSPTNDLPSPFAAGEIAIVFTGAMDYWPNIDAAVWFAGDVLPRLREHVPAVRFYIVGRSPDATVLALGSRENIVVTGTVADVRPYLRHASVVVAPLRIARGIQNKVLEAMAMARPVVATATCAAAVDAETGTEILAAADAAEFVTQITGLLGDPARAAAIGLAARRRVEASYSWDAHLSRIDTYLKIGASA